MKSGMSGRKNPSIGRVQTQALKARGHDHFIEPREVSLGQDGMRVYFTRLGLSFRLGGFL